MTFSNDYALMSVQDSQRIKCDTCEQPATVGQNNGTAPFWYSCADCAQHARETGHFYR